MDIDKEVFNKAAAYIEEKGWVQGRGKTQDGVCCAFAIGHFAGDHDMTKYFTHFKKVNNLAGEGNFGIGVWNDRPERTKEEVLAALRKAAE